jgi:hypothetical protein
MATDTFLYTYLTRQLFPTKDLTSTSKAITFREASEHVSLLKIVTKILSILNNFFGNLSLFLARLGLAILTSFQ